MAYEPKRDIIQPIQNNAPIKENPSFGFTKVEPNNIPILETPLMSIGENEYNNYLNKETRTGGNRRR